MGLLNAVVLRSAYGVRVRITDIREERLSLPERLGIGVLSIEEAQKSTNDQVILAAPVPELITLYESCVAPFGYLVLFGGYPKGCKAEFDPNLVHYKGVKIVGTTGFSPFNFKTAIKLISDEVISLSPFTKDIYDFNDFRRAFDDAMSGKVIKAGLKGA